MEFFVGVGRYFLPLMSLFILLNCAFSLLKGNKKPGTLGYLVNSANGDKIPLKGFETSVGRSNSCDIVLNYNTVSRFHAVLSKHKSGWYVFDTNSKTGSFVNAERILGRTQITDGDSVVFGNAVFRFVDNLSEHSVPVVAPANAPKLYEADEKFYTGEVYKQSKNPASCAVVNESTGESFLLDDLQTCLIGRSDEAHIQIDFPSVSRSHALLSRQGEKWLVEDLDSTCGTLLNNQKLSQVKKLKDGDVIDIAGITMIFKSSK
ncbi:MAG: FHA domain-containing protein [Oscillospiraceae bacterium]